MKAQPEAQDGETPPANAMELIAHLVRHCRDCPLGGLRANAVPGTGPPDAAVMIIAEGPGEHEDRQGKPFVGPAGKFLDKLLAEAGMDRDDVFITNMIKCRAPGNRDPEDAELRACEKHLNRQLIALQPRLIIPLGKFALQRFLPGETIGKAGGRLRNMNGRFVYPVMHPAAGLRRGEFAERITADFGRIPQALRRIEEDPPPPEALRSGKTGGAAAGAVAVVLNPGSEKKKAVLQCPKAAETPDKEKRRRCPSQPLPPTTPAPCAPGAAAT